MSGMKFEKEIFMKYLIEREASEATKKKYMTDVTTFYSYAAEAEEIDKELLLAYREWLVQHYAVSSVNSMLVALNQYLLAVGLGKWKLRRVRVQGCNSKMMERELQKSDYIKLVRKFVAAVCQPRFSRYSRAAFSPHAPFIAVHPDAFRKIS